MVTKLNSNCDKTQTQIFTKLKNANCEKTQILKLWQNSNCDKTPIVREKNTHTHSKCDKTQIWQNSRTQTLTKLKNSNCAETWNMKNFNLRRKKVTLKGPFSKNILTPWQLMRCSLGSVLPFLLCFFFSLDAAHL